MCQKKVKLLINTVEKVRHFVNINTNFIGDIDVCSGRYIIDGKSIMGCFSLDLSKELEATITADSTEDIDRIIEEYKNAHCIVE
jgi:phosphotransferase system HPr-like phosphotransfer protein